MIHAHELLLDDQMEKIPASFSDDVMQVMVTKVTLIEEQVAQIA